MSDRKRSSKKKWVCCLCREPSEQKKEFMRVLWF
jgi:hypothetical protein